MKTLLSFPIKAGIIAMCCFLLLNTAKAQYITIPDARFVNWLNTHGYSQCISGSQMDTTCPAILAARTIKIVDSMHSIRGIYYFKNLDTLKISSLNAVGGVVGIDSLVDLPQKIRYIDAGFFLGTLKHISYLPDSLEEINLRVNMLEQLPPFPPNLAKMICSANPLTWLPAPNNRLRFLDCSLCQLTTLPALNNGLWDLFCNDNLLTALPALPSSLTYLVADHNQLTALPPLPDSLAGLYVTSNYIAQFDSLPGQLSIFKCSFNQITNLPPLPQKLAYLEANNCYLTHIDSVPAALTSLAVNNNAITSLPDNMNLSGLDCSGNDLITINNLHMKAGGGTLDCSNNQLVDLPGFVAPQLGRFSINNNPNFTCLPKLGSISVLNFSNTAITCVPNYGTVGSSTPPLNSVPLCKFPNPGGCVPLWNIAGRAYIDHNSDCVYDAADGNLKKLKIELWSDSIVTEQTFTGGEGFFSFKADSGNYKVIVDSSDMPFAVTCPISNFYSGAIAGLSQFDTARNFGMECRQQFDLVAATIVGGAFRPANETTINLFAGDAAFFYGESCVNGLSGSVTAVITGPCTIISVGNGATIAGNVVTWNVADFATVNHDDFTVRLATDTFAQIGDHVCITLSVSPTNNDYNPGNNQVYHCYAVFNSFDPNNKSVSPVGGLDSTQLWLTYTVRFQNTGNAEAQNIYLADTLDAAALEVSTFKLLAYSHEPIVKVYPNGIVYFNFPKINLPDSFSNEPASHGYVQYKVKRNSGLAPGTQIKNTAFIYFDFNPAVVTNTTTNTIAGISDISTVIRSLSPVFNLFPNPATTQITITTTPDVVGGTLTITDITGRTIVRTQLETSNLKLETTNYHAGLYFVTVTSKQGISVSEKLVIEK